MRQTGLHFIADLYQIENWLSKFIKMLLILTGFNTLRRRQNRRHFADNIFNCILLKENDWIPIEISLKWSLFPRVLPINNIPALVQIMAWRRPGDKPLSEPMVVSLLTHICVTGLYIDMVIPVLLWTMGRCTKSMRALQIWVNIKSVWYKTKFGCQNLATKFGYHLCMATKIGGQC